MSCTFILLFKRNISLKTLVQIVTRIFKGTFYKLFLSGHDFKGPAINDFTPETAEHHQRFSQYSPFLGGQQVED